MRLLLSGGAKGLDVLAAASPGLLGFLATPSNFAYVRTANRTLSLPWAADNGAFHGFDPDAFRRLLRSISGKPGCMFVVCPDAVADHAATLALFGAWSLEVRSAGQPVAFVGQDGCTPDAVPWRECDAYFVGGSTAWKLSPQSVGLMQEARSRGLHVHAGRVNTLRRLRWAYDSGADSVDGSIFTRMADKFLLWGVRYLRRLHEQPTLF